MHPSQSIRGRKSGLLAGRRIVVGISGSIAAVEVPRIIRELIRHGAEVRSVMSPEATRLVTPEAIEFASGNKPLLALSGSVEHVAWMSPGPERADLYLVAPATANTISKIAHGIDDTPVTSFASVALGGGTPILLAPAMHEHMGRNPAVQENLRRLQEWGVRIIEPVRAEGEEKIASPEEVAAQVLHTLGRPPWSGRTLLVIGGAAREPIDAVRSISNESSGATATALAVQGFYRGANVTLWNGSMTVHPPNWVRSVSWGSAADLAGLARREARFLRATDVILVPAAVSDYTVDARPGKIDSRSEPRLTLDLKRVPKILPMLRAFAGREASIVGFKLEARASTQDLTEAARQLLAENDLDAVVANDRSSMGGAETALVVLTRSGHQFLLRGTKDDVAGKLLDDLGREFSVRRQAGRRTPPPGARRPRPAKARRARTNRAA